MDTRLARASCCEQHYYAHLHIAIISMMFTHIVSALPLTACDVKLHSIPKTLSDIFGAINSINLTLTDLTKNLTSITQSIGNIETIINKSQKEITGLIESYSKQTATHLANQDENAKTNVDLLTKKIKGLEEMNIMLKKEIKNNRIFQFIGVGLILAVLIYLIIKV